MDESLKNGKWSRLRGAEEGETSSLREEKIYPIVCGVSQPVTQPKGKRGDEKKDQGEIAFSTMLRYSPNL